MFVLTPLVQVAGVAVVAMLIALSWVLSSPSSSSSCTVTPFNSTTDALRQGRLTGVAASIARIQEVGSHMCAWEGSCRQSFVTLFRSLGSSVPGFH